MSSEHEKSLNKMLIEAILEKNIVNIIKAIHSGACINYIDDQKLLPIHHALLANQPSLPILELLWKYGSCLNPEECGSLKSLLVIALDRKLNVIVKFLVERGVNVNYGGDFKPLFVAIISNNKEMVKYLISYGADVNFTNRFYETPLHHAVNHNLIEITKILIAHNAKLKNLKNNNLLHLAIYQRNADMVSLLLRNGVDVNHHDILNISPLHAAVVTANKTIVNLLLSEGADINAVDVNGMSPLEICSDTEQDILKYNLFRYVIKRKCLNLYISEKNMKYLLTRLDTNLTKFNIKCEVETVRLKEYQLCEEHNFTLYDLLTKSNSSLITILQNDAIRDNLSKIKPSKINKTFSIYSNDIRHRILLVQTAKLFCKGSKLLSSILFSIYNLPMVCVDKIISYLTEEDMQKLVGKS